MQASISLRVFGILAWERKGVPPLQEGSRNIGGVMILFVSYSCNSAILIKINTDSMGIEDYPTQKIEKSSEFEL